MKRIAVFYHTRLDGGEPPIDTEHALGVLCEQMNDLSLTGLDAAASEITVGLNASRENAVLARELIPAKAELVHHPLESMSELPTIDVLRRWLPGHEDWYVLYLQGKGVRHAGSKIVKLWRRCMSRNVVHEWRQCVADLDAGCDSVGSHWLTPERFPDRIRSPYWGGNFWWAKASFLATLPERPRTASCREDFFLAETWIGSGPRRPQVRDYAPHWPSIEDCGESRWSETRALGGIEEGSQNKSA